MRLAFMTACYCEISPDPYPNNMKEGKKLDPDFPYTGVFKLWPKRDESRTDNTTALGAWAWALSRGLDLAERMDDTDASQAVVTGCSRLGQTSEHCPNNREKGDWMCNEKCLNGRLIRVDMGRRAGVQF